MGRISGTLTLIDFAQERIMNVKRLIRIPDSVSDPAESIQIGFPFGKTIHTSVFVSLNHVVRSVHRNEFDNALFMILI